MLELIYTETWSICSLEPALERGMIAALRPAGPAVSVASVRQTALDVWCKSERIEHHESSDSVHWMVHLVRAVLAGGSAGTDSLARRMAGIVAFAPDRYNGRGRICTDPDCAVSPRPRVGLEAT